MNISEQYKIWNHDMNIFEQLLIYQFTIKGSAFLCNKSFVSFT